ncbi:MAG TPA: hypothetical protein VKB48_05030 [Candidatus Acidoferrum sp.]|nr:hypothetical protein [Candidatus Acidoferrum sp.]
MKELTNPSWIIAKGFLFLFLGLLSGALLLLEHLSIKTVVLLAVTVWSFCRFYYFAFYVLERYVDTRYKFSGLLSMMRYVFLRRRGQPEASARR